jgi:hypothetical protein
MRIGGWRYSMDVDAGDLPEWFVRNKWYQYVVAAYDDGDAPGGTTCTAGANCLTINIKNAANATISTKDSVRALVMLSGNELSGQTWGAAAISDYFDEAENTDADDIFDRHPESGTYNDLIRMAVSCPADASKLCWSN